MVKPEDISTVVMAHKARQKYFPYLREKLGDVPFSVDDGELGTWGNRKEALQMGDQTKQYILIIQDDAIICDNFYNLASQFMNEHEVHLYQFFLGGIDQVTSKWNPNDNFIKAPLRWGVAIAMRSESVDPLIEYCDKMSVVPDDLRIKRFFDHHKIQCLYPVPCLVGHRENQSLVGNSHKKSLKTYMFVEDQWT